jgi:predicted unusual protein kinase regulating ubiquinone biosynthesis (AarF/ABC1/UbiB family)
MDYIEGKTLDEFKYAPVHERKLAAETIATFMTKTAFRGGLMNTDTHARNFIFCPGGKVAFIDFGRACTLESDGLAELLRAVIKKDAEAAKPYLPKLFPFKENKAKSEFPYNEIWYFFLKQQSHLHSGEFRFTRAYIAQNMSDGREFPLKKDLQVSIDMIWSLATSMGLWNVFADLDVPVDFGKLSLAILDS